MSERDPDESNLAAAYATRLLAGLRLEPLRAPSPPALHPALRWSRSGLMALTGAADGPPMMCPVPLAACADGVLAALASLAPQGAFDGIGGADLLAERAAIAGTCRNGSVAPGGACRLLEAADGWMALNLARPDDWELLPAWLEAEVAAEWAAVAAVVRQRPLAALVEQGRLLGLALADAGVQVAPSPAAFVGLVSAVGQRTPAPALRRPRVLDLSSLWAGPLCSHLLQRLGADVVKLESPQRPDGARNGPPAFFDLLNAGKRSVALDLKTAEGRAGLRRLIAGADIVIEASRPRALRQLGFDAEALVREHGLSWVSLSGHGRGEPQENWIAYGDDAAVAAGLSALMFRASGQRLIVGDAIADPLTGLHAALAAWASWRQGGGRLLSLSLVEVVRSCLEFGLPATDAVLRERQQRWTALAVQDGAARAPHARSASGPAPALGAHTDEVLAEWDAC
ncbi:MAG TPA: CoA transferase [Ramlibacter sp.]|nr:CoA transferase [Ramlibacter sp.]